MFIDLYQAKMMKTLSVLGSKQHEIAKVFNASQSTISNTIRDTPLEECDEDVRNFVELRARLLAKYEETLARTLDYPGVAKEA